MIAAVDAITLLWVGLGCFVVALGVAKRRFDRRKPLPKGFYGP